MKTPKTLPGVSHTCRLLYVKHTLVFGLYSGGFLQPYQRYFNQAQLRLAEYLQIIFNCEHGAVAAQPVCVGFRKHHFNICLWFGLKEERGAKHLSPPYQPQFNCIIDTEGWVTEPRTGEEKNSTFPPKKKKKNLTFVYRGHRCKDFCYSWQRIKRDFCSKLNENLPSWNSDERVAAVSCITGPVH